MRHLMLVLMILLLPLRGWAGDVMSTGMAALQLSGLQASHQISPLFATENIASHAHDTGAAAHFHSKNADIPASGDLEPVAEAKASHPCGDKQTSAHDGDQADSNVGNADCATCPSCQACHTVALSLTAGKATASFNAVAQPAASAQKFASAHAALSQKPPIS